MTRPEAPAPVTAGTARPLRVLHIITRMIVGGAQETTLMGCVEVDRDIFHFEILCGPETGPEGQLHDETRARGVTLHVRPWLIRAIHPLVDLWSIPNLVSFIRRGSYDVVHTHSTKAGVVGRIAARLAGARIVIHTAHGWVFSRDDPPHVQRFNEWVERCCAPLADALVVVSTANRDHALALGVGRQDQFVMIREGVPIAPYRDVAISRDEARDRLSLPRGALVVGNVGRLSHPKRPLDMLAAFAVLAEHRPDAHLLLAGDGNDRAAVEQAVAASGLADRVHLLGLRRDVPEILRAMDIFLFASLYEGLPRVIVQAMAAGLPIIATRTGGIPDAVHDNETGHIVEIGDIPAMGRRLIELAADPVRARLMGESARGRVDEFSSDQMGRDLEALYRRLAALRGLRVPPPSFAPPPTPGAAPAERSLR